MTMIEVKASKSNSQTNANTRSRFETEGGLPASGTPFYVGFMITALTLYVKSIYGAWAGPVSPQPKAPGQEDANGPTAHHLMAEDTNSGQPEQLIDDGSNVISGKFSMLKYAKSGTSLSSLEDMGFNGPDLGSIDYTGLNLESSPTRAMISQGTAVSFSVMPSNDNRVNSGGNASQASADPTDTAVDGASGSGQAPEPDDDNDGDNSGAAPGAGAGSQPSLPDPTRPVEVSPTLASPTPPADVANDNGGSDSNTNNGNTGSTGNSGNTTGGNNGSTLVNRRPVVNTPVALYDQFACTAVLIALTDLIRNASDPDGDALTVQNATVSSGALILTNGGYTFVTEDAGLVTITYEITDGKLSVTQTASFNVHDKPVQGPGTDGDDIIVGSAQDDQIEAKAGDDTVESGAGNDVVVGGAGNDLIVGGVGNDLIDGGAGNDIIHGGGGDDIIIGGTGNDRVFGDEGNDTLKGGDGDDAIYGGTGNDLLIGEAGHDILDGGDGADRMIAGTGNDLVIGSLDGEQDVMDGGEGIDSLDYHSASTDIVFDIGAGTISSTDAFGNTEQDLHSNFETFIGGSGNDTFQAVTGQPLAGLGGSLVETATTADQNFAGGIGTDTLDYSAAQQGITIDLAHGTASGIEIGNDSHSEIESFIGGGGRDTFEAGPAPAASLASDAAVAEDNFFDGNGGVDTLSYEGAQDSVTFDLAEGTVTGAEIGSDSFTEIESFVGGAAADTFNAGSSSSASPAAMVAIAENNSFIGGAGNDTLDYSEAQQSVVIDLPAGTASGAEIGTDRFSSIETFVAGAGDDTFRVLSSEPVADVSSMASAIIDAVDELTEDLAELDPTSILETLEAVAASTDETFIGGAGSDTLDYSGATADMVFDLDAATVASSEVGTDHFDSIETFVAGSGNDVFQAVVTAEEADASGETGSSSLADVINLVNAAADEVRSEAETLQETLPEQTFIGGAGEDTLDYGAADEAINIDLADATATGSEIGTDHFDGIETFIGGAGNDSFDAGPGSASYAADVSGDETFAGGAGSDTLSYSGADEAVTIDLGAGTASGDEVGTDHFSGIEVFIGGSGGDTFEAGGSSNTNAAGGLSYIVIHGEDFAPPSDAGQAEMIDYADAIDAVIGAVLQAVSEINNTAAGPDNSAPVETITADVADDTVAETSDATIDASGGTGGDDYVAQNQHFNGGDGSDTLSYSGASSDLIINIGLGTASGSDIGNDSFVSIENFVGGSGNDTIIVGAGVISMDGNSGNDMFVFLSDSALTGGSSGSGGNHCQINNFEVGDIIRMSKWDIFERVMDKIEDAFESVYGEDAAQDMFDGNAGDDAIPIRIRYEMSEDMWRTFIDADLDNDRIYEISVTMDGHHDLIIVSNNQTGQG